MQQYISFVFWASLLVMLYTYGVYPVLIFFLSKIKPYSKKTADLDEKDWPALTVVIPAYNESRFIRQKIENTLMLDYPPEKKNIIVVTDGSDDDTPEIVKEFPSVTLLHQPER